EHVPMLPTAPAPSRIATLGAAAGSLKDGFFALGYTPELDFEERYANPEHEDFTHVIEYRGTDRVGVQTLPVRLDDITRTAAGLVMAVGAPRGIIEVASAGCVEVSIAQLPGRPQSICAPGGSTTVICGNYPAFVLYRQQETWFELPVPEGCPNLYKVFGFHPADVYFVGHDGCILHFDGRSLVPLEVPTSANLVSIAPLDDRTLCVGGYHGTLLMGNRSGWRSVPTSQTEQPLLALGAFEGRVFFPAPDGLWAFDGRGAPVLVDPLPCRWISTLDDGLVLADVNEAWTYDGAVRAPLPTEV
ncbi:MAG: hypothetical protein KDK70_38295, partial [Myxococcales bacterium]|nr:hypothetical protein [Myxococcales bacterium]